MNKSRASIYNPVWMFLIFFGVLSHMHAQTGRPNRPNILWITCEDMSPRLSCYGESSIQTPHLDSLAVEGIRYTNAFTTSGVCAPSRSSIITGMYPISIGTDNMRNYNPSLKADSNAVLPSYSAVLPAQVKCFPEYLRLAGYYCTNNAKQDYQFEAPVTVWDESSNKAHWRNRQQDQPFFAVFNLTITHESQLWEREKEPLLVDPATVTVPVYYPDVPEVRHAIARHLSNIRRMDEQAGKIIQQLKDAGLYDKTIIFFFSDHGDGLPNVKREVYDRGLRIPLIIRFPDGYRKGSIDTQLVSEIDFAPTLLSLAGIPVPSYMQGRAFLGEQKTKPPHRYVFAARDRMDTEVDRVRTVRDNRFRYVRNFMPEKAPYQNIKYRLQIPMMRLILQLRDSGLLNEAQMFWFRPAKPPEELYDSQVDPHEMNNLAGSAKYKNKLTELRTVLDDWLKKVGDLHAVPEKELLLKMWQGKDAPPQTEKPEIIQKNKHVVLRSATQGASIGYRIEEQKEEKGTWKVYNGEKLTLPKGKKIFVRAQRIGYIAAENSATF
jgi:N-sulfoglucosamine sulfohydrolase